LLLWSFSSLLLLAPDPRLRSIYVIGSLRNPEIPTIGNAIRQLGYDVFDDWYAAGPTADDSWKEYEQSRGNDYRAALNGRAARHVFEFDKHHLDRCDAGLLVLPAGRSGHLELGYMLGTGKSGFVLMDNPDRWDVMYQFAHGVFFNLQDLLAALITSTRQPVGTDCRVRGN
jgi:hypothetical protein